MQRLSGTLNAAAIGALVFALLPRPLGADMWSPPTKRVFSSANASYRVTVLPNVHHDIEGVPAKELPHLIVERFENAHFVPDWRRKLDNRTMPLEVLISNDGAHLVTLDNYAAVGKGDDVVVIYRRGGELVRKLSLGDLISRDHARYLQRTSSTISWRGAESLVDGDTVLLLQVYEPNAGDERSQRHVPVRIRLADGEVLAHAGPEWEAARAKIAEYEQKRQALWEAHRKTEPPPEGKPWPETPPDNFGLDGPIRFYD